MKDNKETVLEILNTLIHKISDRYVELAAKNIAIAGELGRMGDDRISGSLSAYEWCDRLIKDQITLINKEEDVITILKRILKEIESRYENAFKEECSAVNPMGRQHWLPARIAYDNDAELIRKEIALIEGKSE